jgi:hypothetical protein
MRVKMARSITSDQHMWQLTFPSIVLPYQQLHSCDLGKNIIYIDHFVQLLVFIFLEFYCCTSYQRFIYYI